MHLIKNKYLLQSIKNTNDKMVEGIHETEIEKLWLK
jgi:hypothetical protein